MAAGRTANQQGKDLENKVRELAEKLELKVRPSYRLGRRIWGRQRVIDLVLIDPSSNKALGIECKFQKQQGTAEEKLPAVVMDINSWPIPGLLVFDGGGFSKEIIAYLYATGKAIAFDDLEDWLRLYFGKVA